MLCVASKGETSPTTLLSRQEDRLLREAFGRFGGLTEARAEAAAVVGHYQQIGAGHWFLCDCRPGAKRPPALVPVAQTHIRRHQDKRWPVHCDGCDFYSEPGEQRFITASYGMSRLRPLRLARRFTTGQEPQKRLTLLSQNIRRPGLARLLVGLTTEAGLQEMGADWSPPSLVDQVKALWAAAKGVEIDSCVPLTEFLCTRPARLAELAARIAAVPPGRFTDTRPHGVLIARVGSVGGGMLVPLAGDPIPVRGRLAVFGEHPDDIRETGAERATRAPYLAACVVGRSAPGAPVEVLSAYAHPCASASHLMLVDSDLERRTLAQLRSLQSWLARKQALPVAIEKPMFDVGPEVDSVLNPRPPLIPDFVVRAGDTSSGMATAIVETMGFADDAYRERKQRVHAAMSAALGGAPVVEHDFHEPADQSQEWRDTGFWRALRARLTGPNAVADDRPVRPRANGGTLAAGPDAGLAP